MSSAHHPLIVLGLLLVGVWLICQSLYWLRIGRAGWKWWIVVTKEENSSAFWLNVVGSIGIGILFVVGTSLALIFL